MKYIPGQPKQCPRCKQWFPLTLDFFKRSSTTSSGFRSYCRSCNRKYEQKYVNAHYSKKFWLDKLQALKFYGQACVCCGEHEAVFLTFDHVGGGGSEHRRQDPLVRKSLATWLIKNNYPDGFRVLCFNCHKAIDAGPKHLHSICPHAYKI